MNVLLFGSTGMVGKGVLLECLDDARVKRVIAINRSALGVKHPKLHEVVQSHVADLTNIKEQLQNCDACFFCLGVSVLGLNEEGYTKITYDLTLQVAQTLVTINPNVVFCYVSGAGTDSSERGRQMWARVKGRTENALLQLPFKAAYMFRPGYIQPLKGVRSKTGWYNAVYAVIKPLYFLFKGATNYVTDSVSLGKAMIEVAQKGYQKRIIENRDIYPLSHRS